MALEVLDRLLSRGSAGEFRRFSSLDEWVKEVTGLIPPPAGPFEEAVMGGFTGDRMAYAFAAGYRAALRYLFGRFRSFDFASFCITEEGGGGPGAIETRLTEEEGGYRIDGHKKFISLADHAELFFSAVNAGTEPGGRKRIRIAVIDPSRKGVKIRKMPELPFIPEINHGEVFLEGVMIPEDDLLPGDGYSEYIKPFRTVEDIHIFAAAAGYLFRIATEYQWELSFREELLVTLTTLEALSGEDPLSEHLHLVLGGLIGGFSRFLEAAGSQWDRVDKGVRALWERDRKLLHVAGRIREKRLSRAWEKYLKQ